MTTRALHRLCARTAAGAVAGAWLALALVAGATTARADDLCGSGRPCPRIAAVSPSLLDPPSGPVSVTLEGSGLTGIGQATLLPAGTPLTVTSSSDTALTVVIPARALSAGASYRIQVSVGSGVHDTVQSPAIAVTGGAAAQAPVRLEPPPTVAPAAPPAALKATPAQAAVTESGGGCVLGALLVWAIGLLVGAGACLIIAIRTGLITEVRWGRTLLDRFVAREAELQAADLDTVYWKTGGAPEPAPAGPAAPTWTLAPAAAQTAPRPQASADPNRTQPAVAAWGIREQSKPAGAPIRFRMPPH